MSAVVETVSGPVSGADDGHLVVFRGIPYAEAARFMRPEPPVPWSEVKDCSSFGPSCPQMTVEQMLGIPMAPEAEEFMGVRNYERETGESCLVLNVFAPRGERDEPLPVLVWLHGGGWSTGSASWPLYEFKNLAGNGQVVVVSVNHRIGVLGFLDLSSFDESFADSGNVGMLDIVAALEWIRDNIASVGGDPSNVTVFGESGGGSKVATLLAMPAAQGLFNNAMAMSGAMLSAQDPAAAKANTDWVLDRLGLSTVEDLRHLDPNQLVQAEVDLPGRTTLGFGNRFSPVLGPSLPDHPEIALRAGLGSGVNLVSGCNRDESVAFLFNDPDLWTLDHEGLRDRLELLGDDRDPILAGYTACRPDESPTSLYIAIATDLTFRIAQIRLAEAHSASGGNTYMYLFTWGFDDPTGVSRAPHGLDMPFFFDNVDAAPAAAGPHSDALVAATSGSLVALARTGNPSHDGLPPWPQYTTEDRETMLLGIDAQVQPDPFGAERRCWDGIDVPGLGPRRSAGRPAL